jgi:hypothetical protein
LDKYIDSTIITVDKNYKPFTSDKQKMKIIEKEFDTLKQITDESEIHIKRLLKAGNDDRYSDIVPCRLY